MLCMCNMIMIIIIIEFIRILIVIFVQNISYVIDVVLDFSSCGDD